ALDIAAASGLVWALSGSFSLLWSYLTIAGTGFSTDNQFGAGLWLFITQIQFGQLLGYNILAGMALTILPLAVRSQLGTGILAGLSLFALLPIALSGHASGTAGHAMAVNAMGLHLVSVSIWVGGLIALLLFRVFGLSSLEVVKRYSTLALVGFGLMAVSGVSSATLRIHTLPQLLSPYGVLVLAKVGLLVTLGAIGFWHRRRLIASGVEGNSKFWRLAVVEVAIMGAAIGIATALSKTAPPVSQNLNENPSPAQILTGEPLPPEFTPIHWFIDFKPDLLWLAVATLGIIGYLYGVRRLAKRGDGWPKLRTASWVAGMLLLAYITSGALNVYEQYLFST
ncbi:MAG: CopD family protein, partial [Actinomycetes bacterium]